MAKYWCNYCERKVPKSKEDVTMRVIALLVVCFLGGFLTCGLTWLLILLIPFIQLGAAIQTKCPICGANTHRARAITQG